MTFSDTGRSDRAVARRRYTQGAAAMENQRLSPDGTLIMRVSMPGMLGLQFESERRVMRLKAGGFSPKYWAKITL
jgi:FixJ family two-component response regulator